MSPKINSKNLKRLCWKKGISVADLGRKLGRHRVSIHRAVKSPNQHGPTYRAIEAALS